MKISKKDWLAYINRLSLLDRTAADKMRAYVDLHGVEDTDALVDYAYGIATKYGEGSGALAAEMYDLIAELSGKNLPPAEPAPTPEYGEVAKTVYGTMKNTDVMSDAIGRLVKRTGVDTTVNNAIRDGAYLAWIPNGDTCAFCITLASRGWQKASKKLLKNGHAEHIHAHCDCTHAVSFDGDGTKYGDYDPNKYLEMYENASDGSSQDKINALRRKLREDPKVREKINAQHRASYHRKTGSLDADEYARAVELWNRVKELNLPERNHVIEEFDNWLTPEEKTHCIVQKEIDNYRYFAVTKGHNEYKIYKKEPVTKGIDWLDDVLTEVIGEDWRKYDQ